MALRRSPLGMALALRRSPLPRADRVSASRGVWPPLRKPTAKQACRPPTTEGEAAPCLDGHTLAATDGAADWARLDPLAARRRLHAHEHLRRRSHKELRAACGVPRTDSAVGASARLTRGEGRAYISTALVGGPPATSRNDARGWSGCIRCARRRDRKRRLGTVVQILVQILAANRRGDRRHDARPLVQILVQILAATRHDRAHWYRLRAAGMPKAGAARKHGVRSAMSAISSS